MQKLKLDNFVKREVDRSARKDPTTPLTLDQKQDLAKKVWPKCEKAYKNRMRASALLSDFETEEDLKGEAYIMMWNILDKFDLSKCGQIANFDTEGKTAPKTLEFFFVNYFYGRVNFVACESRAGKKQRGVGPAENLDDVSYDPEDSNADLTEYMHKYDITGELLSELKGKNFTFQRFFIQLYRMQYTQRELREEYKDRFNLLKAESTDFIGYLKEKYKINMRS